MKTNNELEETKEAHTAWWVQRQLRNFLFRRRSCASSQHCQRSDNIKRARGAKHNWRNYCACSLGRFPHASHVLHPPRAAKAYGAPMSSVLDGRTGTTGRSMISADSTHTRRQALPALPLTKKTLVLTHHAYAAYRALMTSTGCGLFSPSWKGLQHSPYGLPEKQGQGAEAAGVLFDLIAAFPLSLLLPPLDAGFFLSAPKPLANVTIWRCLQRRGQEGGGHKRGQGSNVHGSWESKRQQEARGTFTDVP